MRWEDRVGGERQPWRWRWVARTPSGARRCRACPENSELFGPILLGALLQPATNTRQCALAVAVHKRAQLGEVGLSEAMTALLNRWRSDPNGTYRSWFLWEERIKNFRSIRRGIQQVVSEIGAGAFGNAYRGSSLEVVVHSIAEQRQIFKGADHAFLWKPKLRIPDIYEDPDNQRAFGRMLDTCVCCNAESEMLAAIQEIDCIRRWRRPSIPRSSTATTRSLGPR